MPSLTLSKKGKKLKFNLQKLTRDKLYGTKKVVILSNSDEECQRALLSDNQQIITPGQISNLYVDDKYNTYEKKELTATYIDGTPVKTFNSTLKSAVELQLTDEFDLLNHHTIAVYQLLALDLDEELLNFLNEGLIFKADFNYSTGRNQHTIFLIANDNNIFGLVGRQIDFDFLNFNSDSIHDPEDEEDEENDLDFSMM